MSSEPNKPNGLLAALVPYGVLVQPEVALTRCICWLLGLEGAASALDDLVRRNGIEPGVDVTWLTEAIGEERGRTDLEYHWGDPSGAGVVVEAKVGHTLTPEQLAAYIVHLADGGGLLAVLVPEARGSEGVRVMEELVNLADYPELTAGKSIALDVWTFDDVTSELEKHLPGSPDVAQFKDLVQACSALDIFPMNAAELLDDNPTRYEDIRRVVDTASFGRNLPSGSDWSLKQRRYVDLAPYGISMALGVGRKTRAKEGQPQPWAWLRLPDNPDFSRITREVLEELRPGQTSRHEREVWLPLHLPTEEPGSVMVQSVREEIEEIGNAIRERVEEEVKRLDHLSPELKDSASAVLGMRPIDPADLLDDSPARREDIELILDTAMRPYFSARVSPFVSDLDYHRIRYIRVDPLGTHISTSIGRKTHPPATGHSPGHGCGSIRNRLMPRSRSPRSKSSHPVEWQSTVTAGRSPSTSPLAKTARRC